MKDSQITLLFAALAIIAMAGLLFRQRALGIKALLAVVISTASLTGFLVWTLNPP